MALRIDTIVRDSEFLARLNEAETVVIPREQEEGIGEILVESAAILAKYPPETAGNQPPPPYYERGVGMIGFGGLISGKESQNLGQKWDVRVSDSGNGVTGVLANNATYSNLVHGSGESGEEMQTVFHGQHGWPIAKHVVQATAGDQAATTTVKGRIVDIGKNIESSLKRLFG